MWVHSFAKGCLCWFPVSLYTIHLPGLWYGCSFGPWDFWVCTRIPWLGLTEWRTCFGGYRIQSWTHSICVPFPSWFSPVPAAFPFTFLPVPGKKPHLPSAFLCPSIAKQVCSFRSPLFSVLLGVPLFADPLPPIASHGSLVVNWFAGGYLI